MSENTYFVDCEFDGHNGPLLSIALVNIDASDSLYIMTSNVVAKDRWVQRNVLPFMRDHLCSTVYEVPLLQVGETIRYWLKDNLEIKVVSDSPIDIYRFCQAIMTDSAGEWQSSGAKRMDFSVINVDTYPTVLEGARQHNAWWDAMALWAKIGKRSAATKIPKP